MSIYKKLIFPILQRWDAESVHDTTLSVLALAQRSSIGQNLVGVVAGSIPSQPVTAFGLTFPNVLGVAAGFDKDALVAAGLALLGFGHIEVGTVTPRPQSGNSRPRVFRLPEEGALINRMGFPSAGSVKVAARLNALASRKRRYMLGVSLGKQKETPLSEAWEDYQLVMRSVFPYCDYLVINVSSPNTPGLRDLQQDAFLEGLLLPVMSEMVTLSEKHKLPCKPILLKIAPDLTWNQLDTILRTAEDRGLNGIVATNTTVSRDRVAHYRRLEQGGLSGRPLSERSNDLIAYIVRNMGDRLPVIGVGGVFSAEDVKAKLDAGATLVQVYTGLVYEGPGMAGRILRAL